MTIWLQHDDSAMKSDHYKLMVGKDKDNLSYGSIIRVRAAKQIFTKLPEVGETLKVTRKASTK